jgi:hypothetical protein
VRVNASMYDAQQGSTAGAHMDMSTKSGTNAFHGNAYIHRGTSWLNAAPFFFNNDPDIPANQKVPQLHRYTAGGTAGGALIKDKLFGFVSYQHLHVSDQEIGYSRFSVPLGLTTTAGPILPVHLPRYPMPAGVLSLTRACPITTARPGLL